MPTALLTLLLPIFVTVREREPKSIESIIAVLLPLSKKPQEESGRVTFVATPPCRQSSRNVQIVAKKYCEQLGVNCTPAKGRHRAKSGSALNKT